MRQLHQRRGLPLGSLRLFGPPRVEMDDQRHEDADEDEDDQGEAVLGIGDGERVHRWHEIPVEQQRGQDGGHHCRDHPTDQGDHNGGEQEDRDVKGKVRGERVGQQDPGEQRRQDDRDGQAAENATAGQAGAGGAPEPLPCAGVGDDVDIDVARTRDDLLGQAGGQSPSPGRESGRADEDLGGVDAASEGQHSVGGILASDGVELAAKFVGQPAQFGDLGQRRVREAVSAGDQRGEQHSPSQPGRDPRAASQQCLALRSPGEGNHDPLPGGPGPGDAVGGPVALQTGVHLVGQPEQGELPQRGQVPDPEVVGQRGVHLLGLVDIAVGHPAAQRLGRHVDELDLVGSADDLVGHGLALDDAGDRRHHVVERFEVLDVDRRDHVHAGVEQDADVLPALLVAGAGGIGVGEFVHQGDVGVAGKDRIKVHLLQHCVLVGDRTPGNHLQTLKEGGGVRAAMGLAEADDHVRAPLGPAMTLVEHGDGLAHTRGCPEVDPKPAATHGS